MHALKVRSRTASPVGARQLTDTESNFAGQIAAAAWLGRLSDEAALGALEAYAMASRPTRAARTYLLMTLEYEYQRCRQRLDICN